MTHQDECPAIDDLTGRGITLLHGHGRLKSGGNISCESDGKRQPVTATSVWKISTWSPTAGFSKPAMISRWHPGFRQGSRQSRVSTPFHERGHGRGRRGFLLRRTPPASTPEAV